MILHIEDDMTIADLQDKFSECFPLLRIDFFDHPHHFGEGSPSLEQITPDKKIGSIRKIHDPGDMIIHSAYTAGKIERDFKKLFGLHVQVCRKERDNWIQTTSLDSANLQTLSNSSSPKK